MQTGVAGFFPLWGLCQGEARQPLDFYSFSRGDYEDTFLPMLPLPSKV